MAFLSDLNQLQEVLLRAEKNDKKFDFNSIDNGIPLQKKKAKIDFPPLARASRS
jgi:hypothetical protein